MMVMSREYQGARDGKDEGKKKGSECGYIRMGRGGHGDKKNYFGQNYFASLHFSVHPNPVNHPALHVGLQKVFCEVGRWVNLGEKCIRIFQLL